MPKSLINFHSLYDDFLSSSFRTLQDYHASLTDCGSYTNLSRKFAEIKREKEEQAISKARSILAKNAPDAANKIAKHIDSEDERISMDASKAVLDRVGLNVAGVNIHMSQTAVAGVVIPPVFAQSSADEFKALLMGAPALTEVKNEEEA